MYDNYYGNWKIEPEKDRDGSPADLAYGHRFIANQQPMEYLLEFLNVLVGYGYQLGTVGSTEYVRLRRIGLRRFVFLWDDRNRHDFPKDRTALDRLEEALRKNISGSSSESSPVEVIRQLLRSFSAIEKSRSWYAKALFPVHESFLMWEGYRKKNEQVDHSTGPTDLDQGFNLGTRNFFGRGGEMVYLMLSAGTENNLRRREFIQEHLKTLLQANATLGSLADLVEETWAEVLRDQGRTDDSYQQNKGTLGWLPTPSLALYERFAEDVEALLHCPLDPVEAMTLLMHLICFYVVQYLYCRSLGIRTGQADPRPTLLIDALESSEERAIRQASVLSFKRNQELLTDSTKRFLALQFTRWVEGSSKPWSKLDRLLSAAELNKLDQLRSPAELSRAAAYSYVPNDLETKDRDTIADMLNVVWEQRKSRFQTTFLPVHRRLSHEIGLVAPKTGFGQRYVLGDKLIKTLVLCSVKPGKPMEYYAFVNHLFDRYGLVIGPEQVGRAASWLREFDVNTLYYQMNLDAFRQKLKSSGLLAEYSDATGLVGHGTVVIGSGRHSHD